MDRREDKERVRGTRAEQEGEEPIPAPGVPGTQNVVSEPQTPPTTSTQPVQPGHTSADPVMMGEDPDEKTKKAQEESDRRQQEEGDGEE